MAAAAFASAASSSSLSRRQLSPAEAAAAGAAVLARVKPSERILFAHEADLPPLPVPPLKATLAKLLRTVRPHATDEEYEHAEAVCHEFEQGIGQTLQQQLEERAADSRNWLEEWWLTFAYMRPRYPAAVYINWFGLLPGDWGHRTLTQAEAAAVLTRHVLLLRKAILEERIEPEAMAGRKLCMNQWTRMFNTTKVPGEECDELVSYPDLELTDMAVICDGHVFMLPCVDPTTLEPISVHDLIVQFNRILDAASVIFELERKGQHVSLLTSEERTRWAKAYEHLRSSSPINARSLDAIQRSIFVLVLEKTVPVELRDRAESALCGTSRDCRNRWFDKPFNLIIYPDGKGSVNGEHAWADAMVMASVFAHVLESIDREMKTHGGVVMGTPTPLADLEPPTQLEWKLDVKAVQSIELASSNGHQLASSIDLDLLVFPHYGKGLMKRYRLLPDFYVQMAIQLAYYRLHNKFVPTYETGHTRLFYHGRTETIRSSSIESVAFVKTMMSKDASDGAKFDALKKAIDSHMAYARDATMGLGVDRHMMGLLILSEMNGISPKPAIFTDKSIKYASRYVLSTSNISMKQSPLFGGFSPMYEDGYGVCYGLNEESLKFAITSYASCKDTSATKMRQALIDSLIDMQRVCMTRNVIYVGAGDAGATDAASKDKDDTRAAKL